MIRTFLVEDHALMRRGLELIFADVPDIQIVGAARNAASLLQVLPSLQIDVLLLDLMLPDGQGIELLQRVRACRPGLPILILTIHPEDASAARLFDAGASGYISKAVSPQTLVRAVRKVSGGLRYVSPKMAEILSTRDRPETCVTRLPPREHQVLRHLAEGLRTTEIAARMGVSVQTVSTWRRRLLDRLGLSSPGELYVWAAHHLRGEENNEDSSAPPGGAERD